MANVQTAIRFNMVAPLSASAWRRSIRPCLIASSRLCEVSPYYIPFPGTAAIWKSETACGLQRQSRGSVAARISRYSDRLYRLRRLGRQRIRGEPRPPGRQRHRNDDHVAGLELQADPTPDGDRA